MCSHSFSFAAPICIHTAFSASACFLQALCLLLKDGEATLPSLKVFKSSEALLGGRRTLFRLYAGVAGDGTLPPESVVPAVDPRGFVVATQRAKLQDKKERPFLDDPIASLEQIGGRRLETLGCLDQKKLFKELPPGTPGNVSTGGSGSVLIMDHRSSGNVGEADQLFGELLTSVFVCSALLRGSRAPKVWHTLDIISLFHKKGERGLVVSTAWGTHAVTLCELGFDDSLFCATLSCQFYLMILKFSDNISDLPLSMFVIYTLTLWKQCIMIFLTYFVTDKCWNCLTASGMFVLPVLCPQPLSNWQELIWVFGN